MKNIVLLGGSNSVMVNGLQKGLREYANVTNLALGSSTCIQNLFEVVKDKNIEALTNADLIVTESNINELYNSNDVKEQLSMATIFKNLYYLYGILYKYQRPVCILVLPYKGNHVIINNMHRFLANYFGHNIIDIQRYYNSNLITEFGNKFGAHQLAVINRNIGKEIAKNIDCFKVSNKNLDINLPEFKIVTPENMQRNGNFKIFNAKNSVFDEVIYRLEKGNNLSFKGYENYEIIGIHAWNLDVNGEIAKLSFADSLKRNGTLHLKSNKISVVKQTGSLNQFCEIQAEPMIDDNMIAKFNDENLSNTEFYHAAFSWYPDSRTVPYFDLIAFFLCKPSPNMKLFDLSIIPTDKDVEIDPELDRSYLIPNIVFFKDSMEFIDDYIGHLYPNIVKHINSVLTPQIIKKTEAQILSQLNKNTPPTQPSTQLSLEAENKILKDKIKELETNYQKALKTKNHLSYKLGQALIKANKNWYKGGYVKFIFEAMRIKKEHKNRG